MAARKKKQEQAPEPPAPEAPQMPPGQMPPQMQVPPGMMPPAPGGMPPMAPMGQGMPGAPGMQPGMQQPGMQPQMGYPGMPPMGMQANPMMAFMQMMQGMQGFMGGMGMPGAPDPAALPFVAAPPVQDQDRGLDEDVIRPHLLSDRVKTQEAIPTGTALDVLCLDESGAKSLGGLPRGCTMAFAGPPGKGKTRTSLATLARVAASGEKVALIVAEEGFHDPTDSGRDDLCSRFIKVGRAVTGLDEKRFDKEVLERLYVLEAQYHRGQSWDDFVTRYRYLVEKEEIAFVVIDSLNMLDPSKSRTADNLSALKTYNHEQGVTCLCVGQIKETGQPVGGEALMHTADAVFLLEEMSLGSKEMAEEWGGKYRDRIDILRAVKSVTTPTFPHPVRVDRAPETGELTVSPLQPETMKPLPLE